MARSLFRSPAEALLLTLALIVLPLAAGAKEESKMQIGLSDLNSNGNGNGRGNGLGRGGLRADVRTHLQGSKVILQLRASGLDSDTEYVVLCKETEEATDSAELLRFTSASNGSANLSHDLTKGNDADAPSDPRGKYLVIAEAADASMEIAGGWLYGAPQDDGPKTKIKEATQLSADPDSSPSGSVEARYDMRPNGRGQLSISMKGVPSEDYEILVDGVLVATLTPNPGGAAKVDFRVQTNRGRGAGNGHRKQEQLDFDPRRKEILVQLTDDTLMFSGPMIAQIEGLNRCAGSTSDTPLVGDVGSGVAALEVEDDCETAFEVQIADVPAGTYDLYVDGGFIASFDASDDGGGTVAGLLRFDPTPDAGEDEMLLDFPVGGGSLVEVFETGADPTVDLPMLSGTLP